VSEFAFRPRKAPKRVTLSVTPLIDVLFLLVIFFTLTSTFKRVGEMELQLPESTTAVEAGASDGVAPVELVVTEAGELSLDGETLDRAELERRLPAIRRADPERRVLLKAESGVDHGEVVALLDLVREAGFPGVGIGTHRRAPEPAGP
jgi:biopolymer transport protein ExbD